MNQTSLFLSANEKAAFTAYRKDNLLGQNLYWALLNRVDDRAASPGHYGREFESEWWYSAAEYLTDAAMAHALRPSEPVEIWLRAETLTLIRRSTDDWVGPAFRNHGASEPLGHLETGHLTWGLAVVLDLAPDIFTETEVQEIRSVLRERGIPMCRRWMGANNHLANWRCVLSAGITVAAAVLGEAEEIERCLVDYEMSLNIFQPDGSYAESLQYSNYAAYCLMLAREALLRYDPSLAPRVPADPWNQLPRWQAASLFYHKPLSKWGSGLRARCANFNDSSAIFRPSGDLLLHFAAREGAVRPKEAALARWLFDTLYAGDLTQGPHDGATFGFVNDWGFLSVPLIPAAVSAQSPIEDGISELETFSCGDVLVRDSWGGRTIIAIHGGGDPLHGPGHLHGDLNSFILVHNRERLLVDPGHSCYRNLIHDLEGSSRTHNTCTFLLKSSNDPGLQEVKHGDLTLEQSRSARVCFDPVTREVGPLADRGARRLIAERVGDITAVGSEAGALYGPVIQQFSRFWILCGSHMLFVVDRIVSAKPVRTSWHWLLNNRDGCLQLKPFPPDRLVARRGNAGMKLFNLSHGRLTGPEHAYVHDAYHPHPAGIGEGLPGSGQLMTFHEPGANKERTAVHAIALDGYGEIAAWHLKTIDDQIIVESPNAAARWCLTTNRDATSIEIKELIGNKSWTVFRNATGAYVLKQT